MQLVLQALEGDIDTAHLSFLHLGALDEKHFPPGSPAYYFQKDRAPHFEVEETAYGTMYGAYRPGDAGEYYWRIAHFLMPFWTMPPGGPLQKNIIARAWVPVDDENTMFWHISAPIPDRPPIALADKQGKGLIGVHFKLDEGQYGTSDWLGRYRTTATMPKTITVSIAWSSRMAATRESTVYTCRIRPLRKAWAIVDRTQEHLGASDKMIIMTRRRLLESLQAFREQNAVPDGVANPDIYFGPRAGEMMLQQEADWLESYQQICRDCVGLETEQGSK